MEYDVVLKRGDTRRAIKAWLKEPDGKPATLSGSTVRFLMADLRGTVKIDRQVPIQDEASAEVWVVLEAVDVDTAGVFRGEFKVKYPDGRIQTYPNGDYVSIRIVSDLGGA